MVMDDQPSNKLHHVNTLSKDRWAKGQQKMKPITTVHNPFTEFMRNCASSLLSIVAAFTSIKDSPSFLVLPHSARFSPLVSIVSRDDGTSWVDRLIRIFVTTSSCRTLVICFMDWVDGVRKNVDANGGIECYDPETKVLIENLYNRLDNLLATFETTEMHVFLGLWWNLERREYFFDFVQEASNISFFKTYITPSFLGTFYMVICII